MISRETPALLHSMDAFITWARSVIVFATDASLEAADNIGTVKEEGAKCKRCGSYPPSSAVDESRNTLRNDTSCFGFYE